MRTHHDVTDGALAPPDGQPGGGSVLRRVLGDAHLARPRGEGEHPGRVIVLHHLQGHLLVSGRQLALLTARPAPCQRQNKTFQNVIREMSIFSLRLEE